MSGAERCDEIVRLIDEVLGETPPIRRAAAQPVRAAADPARRTGR